MTGTRCSVVGCKNCFENTKREGKNVIYHTFPKHPLVQQIWVERCGRKSDFNPRTGRICSVHFSKDDYQENKDDEFSSPQPSKKLKPAAVPSQHLPPFRLEQSESEETGQGDNKLPTDNKFGIKQKIAFDVYTQTEINFIVNYNGLLSMNGQLKADNEALKEEVEALQVRVSQLESLVELKDNENSRLQNGINSVLTKSQIEMVVNKKKKVEWTNDDITNALTIRYLSKRCYLYLRDTINYPLPAISTLQRWASKIDMRRGILGNVLQMMRIAGDAMTDFEKIVVIHFDEMKVKHLYEYDKQQDEIVGPYSNMQLVMVGGMFSPWEQPIYVDFDKQVTKELLFEMISLLHDISYNVVACVSDCARGNMELWKELTISPEKTYFRHPETDDKIYAFADAPHLLKSIRNWFVDSGFVLDDGTQISSQPVKEFIQSMDKETSASYKLTMQHLNCTGAKRQNLTVATQLLSHNTAAALQQFLPGADQNLARNAGVFIERVASWYSVMNSHTADTTVLEEKPYGFDLERQDEALDSMYEIVRDMRVPGKKNLLMFQRGMLVSIASLKSLFADAIHKYSAEYILTQRLSLESLEGFLSQVKTGGGPNDHPTPLDSIYRIKLLILRNNPGILQSNVGPKEIVQDESIEIVTETDIQENYDVQQIEVEGADSDLLLLASSSSTLNPVGTSYTTSDSDSDDIRYIAGWLARKFKNKYPDLEDQTCKTRNENDYVLPTWLQHLSQGGLREPSEDWFYKVTLMDVMFCQYHKDGTVKKGPNVTKELTNIISQEYGSVIPMDLISAFVRQRTLIRLKYNNVKLKEDTNVGGTKRKEKKTDDKKKKDNGTNGAKRKTGMRQGRGGKKTKKTND